MPRQRSTSLMIVTLLLATMLLIIAGSARMASQEQAAGSSADMDDQWLAAVLPEHRDSVTGQASTMPRYTIAATLILPADDVASPTVSESTPPATPVATPQASPVASPQASPVAFPQASPASAVEETEAAESQDPVTVTPTEVFDEPRVVGTLDLHYTNTTGEGLEELYFRLYPNLRQYGSGRMVIDNVHIDGEPVEVQAPELHSVPDATPIPIADAGERDLAIVRIPLGDTLAPDETTRVRMDFSTTVPIEPPDENGLFRYTPASSTWTLAHWFPMLAGYDPETGWQIKPPAAWSDITFANTALFDITLTAPEELTLVTTGVETDETFGDDFRTARISTGPVRDVAVVAAPGLMSSSTEVGDTSIISWYQPGEETGGETILQWATQSFETFTDLFGPYPYTTLDIVSVPAVIGYEFPQLVFIGSDFYPDPEALGSRPGAIEFLVAHEVAHQWWYGLVGSNPHQHAFLDEGLTEYSTILYFERQRGEGVAASHLRDGLIHRYALMLVTAGDKVADQPTADFRDAASYYATVYRKAGLGFEAIREEIGEEAFVDALHAYAEEHRFSIVTPDDLRSAFEEASGQDLEDLWTVWFESDRGRVEIVMEPIPETRAPSTPEATPAAGSAGTPVATPSASPVAGSPVASPIVEARATPVGARD